MLPANATHAHGVHDVHGALAPLLLFNPQVRTMAWWRLALQASLPARAAAPITAAARVVSVNLMYENKVVYLVMAHSET